ncbi:MAG: DUF1559 domain-containing protein, partial [Gemmataceae bacterium]
STQCRNNLRQLALGTIHFADVQGAFPPARIAPRPLFVGPKISEPDNPTWFVRIMPFIEQENLYKQWDLNLGFKDHPDAVRAASVNTFYCPSRRGADERVTEPTLGPPILLPCGCSYPGLPVSGGTASDYAGNHGDLSPGTSGLSTDFYWGGNGTGTIISSRPGADGRADNWADRITLASVSDGTSNTVLIGEAHIPAGRVAKVPENGPAYDGSRFYNASRVAGVGVPLAQGPKDDVFGMGLYAFGSWHPGGVPFAFVDGHVTFLRTTLDSTTLERLMHRADGQTLPDY